MYNKQIFDKNKNLNKEDKDEILKRFAALKEKIEKENDLQILTKLVYKISILARKNKEILENPTFEILEKIYQNNKKEGYSFSKDEQNPSHGHWLIKAVVINLTFINNEKVDQILSDIILDRQMTWSIRTSAITGLYLRGLKMGKTKNIEILDKVNGEEKDKIVKNYTQKYLLSYKIITENYSNSDLYFYWKNYIQNNEFSKLKILNNIKEEIKELKNYYYIK